MHFQIALTDLPINGCSDFVAIGQLNWVDHSQDFAVNWSKKCVCFHQSLKFCGKTGKLQTKLPYSKFRPDEAGYRIDKRSLRFGSITKTARHVNVIPFAFTSSRSNIFSLMAKSQFESSMIGYGNFESVSSPPYDLISSIHFKCDSAVSMDSAIGLTLRFWNSGYNLATRANSVVQTGVKSAGCEKRMPHLWFIWSKDKTISGTNVKC